MWNKSAPSHRLHLPSLGCVSRVWLFVLTAWGTTACGSTPQLNLVLRAATNLNDSRSVYFVTRVVDEKTFSLESYEQIASLALSSDASIVRSSVVLPGMSQEFSITPPAKGRIAIYALFAKPDAERWRALLPATLPEKLHIELQRNKICWWENTEKRSASNNSSCLPRIP